jgi:hypothetical protein
MPRKRVQFDVETWNALDQLAKDRMQDFQELADEAFADLLRKHGHPTDLKTALPAESGGHPRGRREDLTTISDWELRNAPAKKFDLCREPD